MPNKLRAPFNFVPPNEKVFFPWWTEQISHDLPFSDGISGTIDLTITSMTPIFVRGGDQEYQSTAERPYRFSQLPDDRYFLPATSLKGAVRSVLEILSFGKMSRVRDRRFAVRDLSTSESGMKYRANINPKKIRCGWLWQEGDRLFLEDHGLPWRISYEEIDRWLQPTHRLVDFARSGIFSEDDNRKAKKKYELLDRLQDKIIRGTFVDLDSESHHVSYKVEGEPGILVMTGQSGPRKLNAGKFSGKFFDFIFPEKIEREKFEVPEEIAGDFLSIHQDTPNMELWLHEWHSGERIPVFFKYKEDEKGKKTLEAIGLAYMFRFPTAKSIYTAMCKNDLFDEKKPDLAECMFGCSNKYRSLRGRVQFSHAIAVGNPIPMETRCVVLSTPHPSYYPLYLSDGKSWDSDDARISGRKRYPVRSGVISWTDGSQGMKSFISPLPANTVFQGCVRFHNLRRAELGALLSAILFDGKSDCHHNIGLAKPLGYGKVKIDVALHCDGNVEDYLNEFRALMSDRIVNWATSDQLKELFALAVGITDERHNGDFSYMSMADGEFNDGKGQSFSRFSSLVSNDVTFTRVWESHIQDYLNQEKQLIDLRRKYHAEESLPSKIEDLHNLENLINNKNFGGVEELLNELSSKYDGDPDFSALKERYNSIVRLFDRLVQEARGLMGQKRYAEAIEKFKEAASLGVKSFDNEILNCEEELQKMQQQSKQSPAERISNITLASINAFAGQLRKLPELSIADIEEIAPIMREKISQLKKKDVVVWKTQPRWKPIVDVIGDELANRLFELIWTE